MRTKSSISIILSTSCLIGLVAAVIDLVLVLFDGNFSFTNALLHLAHSYALGVVASLFGYLIILILLAIGHAITKSRLRLEMQKALLIAAAPSIIAFLVVFEQLKLFLVMKTSAFEMVSLIVAQSIALLTILIISTAVFRSFKNKPQLNEKLDAAGWKLFILPVLAALIIPFVAPAHTGMPPREQSAPAPAGDLPNIVLMVIDTARADRFSFNGYFRNTSPNLDRESEQAIIFENAFSTASWTLPAHATLFTGYYSSQHKTNAEHQLLYPYFETLAERLADKRYQTVCFSNNPNVSPASNMLQGFESVWYSGQWLFQGKAVGTRRILDSFFQWLYGRLAVRVLSKLFVNNTFLKVSKNAEQTNLAVTQWLTEGRDKNRPFFIFINYMDVHSPYDPPDEFARLYLSEEELELSYHKPLRSFNYSSVKQSRFSDSDISIISSLYDAQISYLDGQLGRLLDRLKESGLYDSSAIVITSDHGEYLGEHNRLRHGNGLDDPVTKIPLLLHLPGGKQAGKRIPEMVSLIDVYYTISDLAQISELPKGAPEFRLLHQLNENNSRVVFAEDHISVRGIDFRNHAADNTFTLSERKSIRDDRFHYIWKSRGTTKFYDVREDPLETTNLIDERVDEAADYHQRLFDWFDSLYIPSPATGTTDAGASEDMQRHLNRLRALGYIK